MKNLRYLIFLKDVLIMACTGFGGPQAHLTMYFNILVKKRKYLSEEELLNLYSFCQILPGPASTQTIIAVGFRLGGARLAFLTVLIWMLPAVVLMTATGILVAHLDLGTSTHNLTRFVEPMAIGFVGYAAVRVSLLVFKTRLGVILGLLTAFFGYIVQSPAIFPIVLIASGCISAYLNKTPKIETVKQPIKIEWANLILFAGIGIGSALIGYLTKDWTHYAPVNRAVLLFENFFRNGSLVFGGGQTLIALMHKQFVEFKGYLSADEFLTGYAMVQVLPGPLFSFSSYIGALAMRPYGIWGQIAGGFVGAVGIFLPGTILIFFVIRFWDKVKSNRILKASLEGINAGSAGILIATAMLLSQSLETNWLNAFFVVGTFLLLQFTNIYPALIIIAGILLGVVF